MEAIKKISKPALVLIALAALGLFAFSKKHAIDVLNYYIPSITAHLDGATPVLRLLIAIQNPGNDTFSVTAIVGNIFIDGKLIGNVSSYARAIVPGPGEVRYPLDLRISLAGVALDVYNFFSAGIGGSHELKFSGYLNGNGLVLPVDLSYKVGG